MSKTRKEEQREYCPICEPGLPAEIPGVVWVIAHHATCLQPILEREQSLLETMEAIARQKQTLDAIMEVTAVIAGNR